MFSLLNNNISIIFFAAFPKTIFLQKIKHHTDGE